MNRNRLFIVAAFLCAAALVPAGASAQTAALAVSANVNASCTISTNPVAFGTYDPILVNILPANTLDATGGVVIACTKNSAPKVSLGLGSHAAGAVRQMLGPTAPDLLAYELYQPGGFTTVWGTGAAEYTPAVAPSKAARTLTVNGRIAGGQDVAVGAYTDSVVATVHF
jgi:spore coat protein U-like protein